MYVRILFGSWHVSLQMSILSYNVKCLLHNARNRAYNSCRRCPYVNNYVFLCLCIDLKSLNTCSCEKRNIINSESVCLILTVVSSLTLIDQTLTYLRQVIRGQTVWSGKVIPMLGPSPRPAVVLHVLDGQGSLQLCLLMT